MSTRYKSFLCKGACENRGACWYIDEMATDGCILHGSMHAAYTRPRPNGCVWPLGLTFAKGECESVRHGLRQTAGGLSVPGRDIGYCFSAELFALRSLRV